MRAGLQRHQHWRAPRKAVPERLATDDAQPGVSKRVVEELATLRFVRDGHNVLILGPTGVGKTHIAIGLALKAIEHGYRAYFLTLHDLVHKARAARERNRLQILHASLQRADVFCLDEVAFEALQRDDATFLFEVINKRYAAGKSTILTSNKSYAQWDEIFPDPILAVALLDRLLHHSSVVNIRGPCSRQRHRRAAGLTPTVGGSSRGTGTPSEANHVTLTNLSTARPAEVPTAKVALTAMLGTFTATGSVQAARHLRSTAAFTPRACS